MCQTLHKILQYRDQCCLILHVHEQPVILIQDHPSSYRCGCWERDHPPPYLKYESYTTHIHWALVIFSRILVSEPYMTQVKHNGLGHKRGYFWNISHYKNLWLMNLIQDTLSEGCLKRYPKIILIAFHPVSCPGAKCINIFKKDEPKPSIGLNSNLLQKDLCLS